MNFVVFSWNFLPQNDPEAYCTARFVSALAESGHNVQVVTPAQNQDVPREIVAQILSSMVKVTNFEQLSFSNRHIAYLTKSLNIDSWTTATCRSAIKALKRCLRQTKDAVLVSRAMPMKSNLIAYRCRRYARFWVAHFSDPFPWNFPTNSLKNKLTTRFALAVTRRVLLSADAISITCRQVLQFFEDKFSGEYESVKNKFFVTPHIGEPLLEPVGEMPYLPQSHTIVSHCGLLCSARYCDELLRSLKILKERDLDYEFVQLGHLDISAQRVIEQEHISIRQLEVTNPSVSTVVNRKSKACLVLDTRTAYETSLFIPSKFVYLLFTESPIVAYTPRGSAMQELTEKYPEAGLVWADPANKDSLVNAVEMVIGMCYNHTGIFINPHYEVNEHGGLGNAARVAAAHG